MDNSGLSLEEYLYFGSVDVTFDVETGCAFSYETGNYQDAHDQTAKDLANKRFKPVADLGPEYEKMQVPAIPATDPVLVSGADTSFSKLPVQLQKPLLKKENGSVRGLQSGRRSALIKIDNKWYRLKGCGDLYGSFPIIPVPDNKEGWVNIRGSMFEHTTSRELLFQDLVQKTMEKNNYQCANHSKGWWVYDIAGSTHPLVNRCCAISETLGNRRLGDNALTGLERLIPHMLSITAKELFPHFPPERIDEERNELWETFMLALSPGVWGDHQDMTNFDFKEKCPASVYPGTDPRWLPLWDQYTKQLNEWYSNNPGKSLMAYAFWRFGREAGEIFKALHDEKDEISWGTYVDPLGTHCNAHVNNLVILPKGSPHGRLLAPLDFDMAFTASTFSKDEQTFQEWMTMEQISMKLALAAYPDLTSGVLAEAATLTQDQQQIQWALRDTLIVAYESAMNGAPDPHPPNHKSTEDALYALLGLALIVSEKEVA